MQAELQPDFGKLLRYYRKKTTDSKGYRGGFLSQEKLAELLSEKTGQYFHRNKLEKWEKGQSFIHHQDERNILVGLIEKPKSLLPWRLRSQCVAMVVLPTTFMMPSWLALPDPRSLNLSASPYQWVAGLRRSMVLKRWRRSISLRLLACINPDTGTP